MLLEKTRRFNINAAIIIITINTFFLIISLGVPDNLLRAGFLLWILIASYEGLKALKVASRIDPMVAISEEFSDQQILFAQFEKQPLDANLKVLPEIKLADLQLNHYMFVGFQGAHIRNNLIRYWQGIHKELIILDSYNQNDVIKAKLEVKARKDNRGKDYPSILLCCDKFENANALQVSSLGIYLLIVQPEDNKLFTGNKFLPQAIAQEYHQDFPDSVGYWDGRKMFRINW